MTVAEVAAEWLALKERTVRVTTHARYRWLAEALVVPLVGDTAIAELDPRGLQRYIDALAEVPTHRGGGYGQTTIHDAFQVLKMLHKYAARMGYVAPIIYEVDIPRAHDWAQVGRLRCLPRGADDRVMSELISLVRDPATPRAWDRGPVPSVDAAYRRRYALAALFGLWCGMRIGEACAIRRTDIDLDAPSVTVSRTAISWHDRASGRQTHALGPTKTRESERTIPLSPVHAALIGTYAPASGFIVPGSRGRDDVPYKRGLSSWFSRLMRAMGHTGMTFHALRHTFATRLLDDGADIKTVSELLGHKDVTVTMRLYLHPDERSKARAIAGLTWRIQPPAGGGEGP